MLLFDISFIIRCAQLLIMQFHVQLNTFSSAWDFDFEKFVIGVTHHIGDKEKEKEELAAAQATTSESLSKVF